MQCVLPIEAVAHQGAEQEASANKQSKRSKAADSCKAVDSSEASAPAQSKRRKAAASSEAAAGSSQAGVGKAATQPSSVLMPVSRSASCQTDGPHGP